jgi:hypothetical protein
MTWVRCRRRSTACGSVWLSGNDFKRRSAPTSTPHWRPECSNRVMTFGLNLQRTSPNVRTSSSPWLQAPRAWVGVLACDQAPVAARAPVFNLQSNDVRWISARHCVEAVADRPVPIHFVVGETAGDWIARTPGTRSGLCLGDADARSERGQTHPARHEDRRCQSCKSSRHVGFTLRDRVDGDWS